MADTIEKTIYQVLVAAAKAVVLPTGWDRVLPGVTYAPTAISKFVSFELHFNKPIPTDSVSQELPPIRRGFVRANVMLPKASALVDGIEVSGLVCAAFKIGTKFNRSGVQVRIDEHPEVGPTMTGATHHATPVTIDFHQYPIVPA